MSLERAKVFISQEGIREDWDDTNVVVNCWGGRLERSCVSREITNFQFGKVPLQAFLIICVRKSPFWHSALFIQHFVTL